MKMRSVVQASGRCVPRSALSHASVPLHRNVATAAASHCNEGPSPPLAPAPWQQRSEVIMGADALVRLANASVTVIGLGGVGSWCAEMLCRAGVGSLVLLDGDDIDSTNRNRQLPALSSTIGRDKVEVLADRMRDINPAVRVEERLQFLVPEAAEELVLQQRGSFLVDCIDSVAPKVYLIAAAVKHGVPIISAMGAGGKVDPACVQVVDISETHNDRFARLVRKELRARGVYSGVPVVFSPELTAADSMREVPRDDSSSFKRSFYGTMPYMPATFGMHVAAHVTSALSGYGGLASRAAPRRKPKKSKTQRTVWPQTGGGVGAEPAQPQLRSDGAARPCAEDPCESTGELSDGAHAEEEWAGRVDASRGVGGERACRNKDGDDAGVPDGKADSAARPDALQGTARELERIRGDRRVPPIPPGLLFDI